MAKMKALLCGALFVAAMAAVPMTMTGCGNNGGGDQMKQAGESTKNAAKHTGKAVGNAADKAAESADNATD